MSLYSSKSFPTIHEISVTIYPLSVGMLICRPYRLPASCMGLWNQHNNRSKPVAIVGHRMGLPQSKKKGHTHTGHKIYAPLAKKFRLYFMGLLFSGFRPVFLGFQTAHSRSCASVSGCLHRVIKLFRRKS